MISEHLKGPFVRNGLSLQIIVACGLGLILGIACGLFSGVLVSAVVVAILFIYATFKRPEVALLGILVATSSIVFEDQLPIYSLGGISLHIPDFLLLGMFGIIAVRWFADPAFRIVRTPLDWPLLIFFVLTLISTLIAIYHSSVAVEDGRRMIRIMAYYLTFFVVTNLVKERRQLNLLINGFFLLATFVAAVMILQYFLGASLPIVPGRVEVLVTPGGVAYSDVTRILPPGLYLVLTAFVTVFCMMILEKFRPQEWLKFSQFGLLGLALLFTFLRSYWAALIIAFILLIFILKGQDRQKFLNWGLVIISAGIVLVLIALAIPDSKGSNLVAASQYRLSTLFSIGTYQGQDSSINWRIIEDKYALSSIAAHPVIGLGMGAKYRPWDSRLDFIDPSGTVFDFTTFIHNGYLWILLDTGALGFLALMWFSIVFLIRGFRHWRKIHDGRMKGIVLGFTLAYVVLLIGAATDSTFIQWALTPVIGIMMGVNEVILRNVEQATPVA